MTAATATLFDSQTGGVVCEACELATTPLRRMRGLLGRDGLDGDQGMWIRPTFAIHTWFMRFPIDAVFLDRDLRVLRVVPALRPWRGAACRGARSVLELRPGEASQRGIQVGARLTFEGWRGVT